KILLPGRSLTDEHLLRFHVEAQSVARLRHSGIVQVYDVGEWFDTPYMVLEFMNTGTLAEWMRGTPVSPATAAAVLRTLARSIDHAHRHGIIHRDLKPANILLHTDRAVETQQAAQVPEAELTQLRIKIADFGLARLIHQSPATAVEFASAPTAASDSLRTAAGQLLGTPAYMAPEQAVGRQDEVGVATDVHALGVILFELLTGRPPFIAASAIQTLRLIAEDDPPSPRSLNDSVPPDLAQICLKCLCRNPAARYLSAAALSDDLERFLDGRMVTARRPPLAERLVRRIRRKPVATVAAGLLFCFLIAAGVAWNWSAGNQREARITALLEALQIAEPDAVGSIVEKLSDFGWRPSPTHSPGKITSRSDLNLCIATLSHSPESTAALTDYLPFAKSRELPLLITAIRGHMDLTGRLRTMQLDQLSGSSLLNYACVISATGRQGDAGVFPAATIADALVRQHPVDAQRYGNLLLNSSALLSPALWSIATNRSRDSSQRSLAVALLAEFLADSPGELAELSLVSEPASMQILMPRLLSHPTVAADFFQSVFDDDSNPLHSLPPETESNSPAAVAALQTATEIARRRALSAIALAQLGRPNPLVTLLQSQPDPTARSFAIEMAGPSGLSGEWFVTRFDRSQDAAFQQACLLAIDACRQLNADTAWWHALQLRLPRLWHDHPDGAVHSAINWLMRRADVATADVATADRDGVAAAPADKLWFRNSLGQTFVIVEPGSCGIGSPAWEEDHEDDETEYPVRLTRRLAVSTTEVTVADFVTFQPKAWVSRKYSPHDDCPMVNVSWFDAARYCRWVSEREEIPETEMCFPPLDQIKPGMKLPADYLSRNGYRLPTEFEWEYCCRASTTSSWSFGYSAELFSNYGWVLPESGNQARSVGQLKPNSFGIFDLYGNAVEWCAEARGQADRGQDGFSSFDVPANRGRSTRGGSFGDIPQTSRSARRSAQPPGSEYATTGFRLIRTYPSQ
ncbi:MAG: SUMF1/EgtB/PvdO family nonheme iron enzyme, partial [Planctomycetaceae bacterium]|nr:SUMF1/EgtB/PvdO family nonheme iron enzyme [Planctomycetaceae bacterium]